MTLETLKVKQQNSPIDQEHNNFIQKYHDLIWMTLSITDKSINLQGTQGRIIAGFEGWDDIGRKHLPKIVMYPEDIYGVGTLRMFNPAKEIHKAGFANVFITNSYSEDTVDFADLVVFQRIQREAQLFAMEYAQKAGKAVVMDADDNFYAIRKCVRKHHEGKNGGDLAKIFERAMMKTDVLTVSTPELVKCYKYIIPSIFVCPNRVEYEPYQDRVFEEDHKLTIGFAGSGAHPDDWINTSKGLTAALRRHPEVNLVVAGRDYSRVFPEDISKRIITRPWATYDTFRNLYIDFDIGIAPIVDSRFNRCKCLDVNTVISTEDGMMKISEIKPGDQIWNGKEFVNVIAREDQSVQDGLKLKTSSGYEITLTKNHRLMSNDGWKYASDFKIGETISMSCLMTAEEYKEVKWDEWKQWSNSTKIFNWSGEKNTDTVKIDSEWGEFIAALITMGDIVNNKLIINFGPKTYHLSSRCKDIYTNIGMLSDFCTVGLELTEFYKLRSDLDFTQDHLIKAVLKHIGVIDSENNIVRNIPDVIKGSEGYTIISFLRYIISALSYIDDNNNLTIESDNESFIKDIHLLLLGINIKSTTGENGEQFKVSLGPGECGCFMKKAYYLSSNKKTEEIRKYISESGGDTNNKDISIKNDIIVSIEQAEVNPVDIQVDGEVFIANGFISHNSEIKMLDYGVYDIACIGGNVAPYKRFYDTGLEEIGKEVILLASSSSEWENAIERFVLDKDLRLEFGARNSEFVRRQYDIKDTAKTWWPAWEKALIKKGKL